MPAADRLPEQTRYRDRGCSVAPRCLDCPLPVCKFEAHTLHLKPISLCREQELRPLLARGLRPEECAALMGISRRQVFRLKRRMADRERAQGRTWVPLEGL